jgi:hypothetical protein
VEGAWARRAGLGSVSHWGEIAAVRMNTLNVGSHMDDTGRHAVCSMGWAVIARRKGAHTRMHTHTHTHAYTHTHMRAGRKAALMLAARALDEAHKPLRGHVSSSVHVACIHRERETYTQTEKETTHTERERDTHTATYQLSHRQTACPGQRTSAVSSSGQRMSVGLAWRTCMRTTVAAWLPVCCACACAAI